MAEEMVSAEGWISDESSFYGDEDEQAYQRDLCEEFKPKPFWHAHHKELNIVSIAARAPQLKPASAMTTKPFSIAGLDRKAMEQERLARTGKRRRDSSPEPRQFKAPKPSPPELELFNPQEGRAEAWQLGESVDDFIKRLPPFTTSIFTCPWIWAENPCRNPRDKSPCPRVEDFTARGTQLLEQSLETRRDIQKTASNASRSVMIKQLNQESKALERRIADLANETNVLSGKWMLFPTTVDVTRVWKQVVASVIDNRLGTTCKVATDDGRDERLICVYTKDFQDAEDVMRVLHELDAMSLMNAGKTIYYKPDAYTYLDLRRETASEYGLQASLYNSRSMMAAGKVSKTTSGSQKKQATLNKFF